MKNILLYIYLFFFFLNYSQQQDLYHKVFTKNEDFKVDIVQSLLFDNEGFLWIGGNNLDNRIIISGERKSPLQFFDGFTFHTIEVPKKDKLLKGIQQLFKRKDGLFYVVINYTDGHELYLFNTITKAFSKGNIKTSQQKLHLSNVFSFKNQNYIISQVDREITVNVLSDNLILKPLFSFTSNENTFLVENSTQFIGFDNFCVVSDDNFQVYYFNWDGTLIKSEKLKQKKWIDEAFSFNNKQYIFKNDTPEIYEVNESLKSFIPLKTKAQLNSLHLKAYNDLRGNHILTSYLDNNISINRLTDFGLVKDFDFPLKKCDGLRLASENLENDLWLATNSELHYFKFPAKKVKSYLKNHSIRALQQIDDANLIVSTEAKGWFNFDIKNDSIWPIKTTVNGKKKSFQSSRNIIKDKNKLWATSGSNISLTNTANFETEFSRNFPIICLEQVNDTKLLYGTNSYHLISFNKKTKAHKNLLKTDSLYIYDIAIKDKNNIVCATDKGLLFYNYDKNTHKFYGKSKFEDNYLLMADYDKTNGFLLGSRNGYIYKFDEINETMSVIYKDQFKAGIATILPLKNNRLWINTFNGFVDYDIKTKSALRYSDKDGFSNNEANRYSAFSLNDKLYVGTLNGLNVFNPKELKQKEEKASLSIISTNAYNSKKAVFEDNYNQSLLRKTNLITLPVENRALKINFGLKNNYARDNGYSFQYRLGDKDWVNLKQQNTISFPNLAAGNYDLEIKALDFSGRKVGNSLILKIDSQEFFYKTWWFLVTVSLVIIAVLLYFLRQFQLRKKLQDQFATDLIQSQENERKRIARELHDSVSQQLTLIKRKAQSQSQDEISELTNNTLEEVRHISRGLFPPLLKQLGLTESIEQLALDIDENNDIFVTTDIKNIDKLLNEDQALHLYRFIQESINNILKHAKAKAFSIHIIKEKTVVLIQIKDNGVGFDTGKAKNKNSLGLKTMEERVRLLNGELTIDSKQNRGTLTEVKISI